MGLFDKLRAPFSKASSPASSTTTATEKPERITVYDKFGQQLTISRDEWRAKVLPGRIKEVWNNPDELYDTIVMAMNDGFFTEVLEASERLLAIDGNSERAHTVRGIVLMKTGDLDGAEDAFQQFIRQNGPTGSLLTNLAKVYSQRGQKERSEAVLWEGLNLDPNQENGLMWWGTIHGERNGKTGFIDAVRKVAAISGSWRPQLWLARNCLENKQLNTAKIYYEHVLAHAVDVPGVLMMISGDLGKNGFVAEVLKVALPVYQAEKHGLPVGVNILQAYLETKNYPDGEQFLHKMFAMNRPDWKQNLMYYAAEFDKLRIGASRDRKEVEPPVSMGVYTFDCPIWRYGLEDPQWLIPAKDKSGKGLVFIALANTTKTDLVNPAVQQEEDLGRLTRSIPLYLLESFYFWSALDPKFALPVVMGKGPVVSGAEWPAEHVCQFAKGVVAEIAVAGSLRKEGDELAIHLAIWDCPEIKVVRDFDYRTTPQLLGSTILQIEDDLLAHFGSQNTIPTPPFYTRPSKDSAERYLGALGQSLALTLGQNNLFPKDQLWGERNIFDWSLALALEMNGSQAARILFLCNLGKGKGCGSAVFNEYRKQALTLLEDEKSEDSEFYRLSPLLFKLFDMREEFEQRKHELMQGADQPYREWLEDLSKPATG